MKRDQVLEILGNQKNELDKFKVKYLALFGSVARGEERTNSDVDILVDFTKPVGLFEFVRLKIYLEGLLNCSVDLVTPDAIREKMHKQILKEAIYA